MQKILTKKLPVDRLKKLRQSEAERSSASKSAAEDIYASFYPQDSKPSEITPEERIKITDVLAAVQALTNYYLINGQTDYGATNDIESIKQLILTDNSMGYFSENANARKRIALQLLDQFRTIENFNAK